MTSMHAVDRLQLATSTYRAAVAAARASSSPAAWRRLVRAGWNLRQAEAEVTGEAGPPAPGERPRRTVLLVEDEPDTRDSLRDLFVDHGFTVWAAEDGAVALDYLHHARVPPSVILLDLVLPGMSGWELRDNLLGDRALARIPVVAMSGARGAEVRGVRLFRKPFDVTALLETVARAAGAR